MIRHKSSLDEYEVLDKMTLYPLSFYFGGRWVEQNAIKNPKHGATVGFAVGKDRVKMSYLQFANVKSYSYHMIIDQSLALSHS